MLHSVVWTMQRALWPSLCMVSPLHGEFQGRVHCAVSCMESGCACGMHGELMHPPCMGGYVSNPVILSGDAGNNASMSTRLPPGVILLSKSWSRMMANKCLPPPCPPPP